MNAKIPLPDACQMAGVPYQTVYHAILRGAVSATRVGRAWQIDKNDISKLSHLTHRKKEQVAA